MLRSSKTVCAICTFSALLAFTPIMAAENNAITNIPPAKLQWNTSKEGVGFAPLQGDRFKESYMAMVRLPAGLVSPPQMKTANMYGMVVSGTITHIAIGAGANTEVELPAGSYYQVPAGLVHISKCVSSVDCVTFLYQDGKFDFLPVNP